MFGFIITRCVNENNQDLLWRECLACVRELYPVTPFIIIDDHSTIDIDTKDLDDYTIVVHSELAPGIGELLPYFYLYTYKYFDKAIIMHDSVFLQKPFKTSELENIQTVRFLWKFYEFEHDQPSVHLIKNMLTLININENTYDSFEWKFHACFGVMSIITTSFLDALVNKYPLFSLLPLISTRAHRKCIERIFAIACFMYLDGCLQPSMFGKIRDDMPEPFTLTYDTYKKNKTSFKTEYSAIKVYSSR